jgi:hypothetical protein
MSGRNLSTKFSICRAEFQNEGADALTAKVLTSKTEI